MGPEDIDVEINSAEENDLLEAVFIQEDSLANTRDSPRSDQSDKLNRESPNISNISTILLNNGINLNNISSVNVSASFASSSLRACSSLQRRVSQRQAESCAKQQT